MKIVLGVVGVTLVTIPAIVGRVIQISHYHYLSVDARLHPVQVTVEELSLPRLQPCQIISSTKFHGTKPEAAIGILRWGFAPSKTLAGAKN